MPKNNKNQTSPTLCVYCGKNNKKDGDHLPPRSFWPPGPVAARMQKVPVCKACHTSCAKDEGYFKSSILVRADSKNNPKAGGAFKAFIEDLKHPKKSGFRKAFTKRINRFMVETQSGLIVGTADAITIDYDRIKNFSFRMLKGYYWVEKNKILPSGLRPVMISPQLLANRYGTYSLPNLPITTWQLWELVAGEPAKGPDPDVFSYKTKTILVENQEVDLFLFEFYRSTTQILCFALPQKLGN